MVYIGGFPGLARLCGMFCGDYGRHDADFGGLYTLGDAGSTSNFARRRFFTLAERVGIFRAERRLGVSDISGVGRSRAISAR